MRRISASLSSMALGRFPFHVQMKDFRRWLAERGNTPAQITARQRAREVLGEAGEPSDREKRRRWQEERNR
jgi:hypothetical protein